MASLYRKPLAVDKTAAKAMLNEIVKRVEREKAGLVDPTEEQRKRPLAQHIEDFQAYLRNKGVGPKQVGETMRMVKRMVARRLKEWIAGKGDLSSSAVLFPVSGRVPGGTERKTNKMLELDLMAARDQWIEEAKTPGDQAVRECSDFLC